MQEQIPPKLRWACRRGMLELDVLLGNFLEERYLGLSQPEQMDFVSLLNENDQDLFMWLTGKLPVADAKLAVIVGKIRYHAANRHHN
jgi:antitoxin CptB